MSEFWFQGLVSYLVKEEDAAEGFSDQSNTETRNGELET